MSKRVYRGLRPQGKNGRDGLRNPERGFRFEIGVGKIPADFIKFTHVTDHWPFERFKRDGVTIAQAYCYLTQYYDSDVIPQEKLDALQRDFDRARADGVKFLFRFAYEFDDGKRYGPTAETLLRHMAQLKEIVRKNMDVIYVLQTGWVGLWGEFHTSVHGLEKDPATVAEIVKATLDMLPEDRFTMMRRMQYKINALTQIGDEREITSATAFSNAPHARIGFFNDGTLANYWDGGTFVVPPYAAPGNPEFDRIAREGCYMPVDGELFWTGQFSDPKDATGPMAGERFTAHHYSTFSLVHGFSELDRNPAEWTIDTWKKQPVTAETLKSMKLRFDPDWFDGVPERTWFEYIRDHLGYRLAVCEADIPDTASPNGKFAVSATLKNYGFSTPINSRFAHFALIAPDGGVTELPTDYNLRQLQPCMPGGDREKVMEHRISLETTLPALAVGTYQVALWLPDAAESLHYRSEYCIRLASEVEMRILGGRLLHVLGEVSVK